MQRLAEGASAEVFVLDEERVLKLFRPSVPRGAVDRERAHAEWAYGQGLPVPRALDIVHQAGRVGIVFERREGPTLFEALRTDAEPPEALAALFFTVQRRIHHAPCSRLLPLQPSLARRIAAAPGIGDDLKKRALAIAQAPTEVRVPCHGDFHPQNVILWRASPVVVDWMDLGGGDPAMDVTRTLLFLQYARRDAITASTREAFVRAYRAHCLQAWAGREHELSRWVLPMALVRMARPGLEAPERVVLSRVANGELMPWG